MNENVSILRATEYKLEPGEPRLELFLRLQFFCFCFPVTKWAFGFRSFGLSFYSRCLVSTAFKSISGRQVISGRSKIPGVCNFRKMLEVAEGSPGKVAIAGETARGN